MKLKKAFTMAETMIAMTLLGVIASIMMSTLKPNDFKKEVLEKAGKNSAIQIDFASKQILAKYTKNYSYLDMFTASNVDFSITDSGADAKLAPLFKKFLNAVRNTNLSSAYTNQTITDANGVATSLKISNFTQGFLIKNGTYIAFKLNGNCTTSETLIYNPALPDKRTANNSCGLIFYDVNGGDGPNALLIDQYIISIGKHGIK